MIGGEPARAGLQIREKQHERHGFTSRLCLGDADVQAAAKEAVFAEKDTEADRTV